MAARRRARPRLGTGLRTFLRTQREALTRKAFADHARQKWGLILRTSAPAGTPVAYGRIVEWKGRPEVDIVRGGESALFHLDLLYRGRASEAAALGVILILLAAASTVVINRLAGIRMGGVFG